MHSNFSELLLFIDNFQWGKKKDQATTGKAAQQEAQREEVQSQSGEKTKKLNPKLVWCRYCYSLIKLLIFRKPTLQSYMDKL